MKKKKQIPGNKEDNMNAFEDTHVYAAGHEADEKLDAEDDITKHTNGGIPDDIDEEDDDEEDDDDERA